ncbi:MAG: hypothetical protein QOF76_2614 [Solirubrobacteraceae bacterium]|jgi:hypothetical protein|nr:hypothetical protein [Solirubrobacteraceae bacterium]
MLGLPDPLGVARGVLGVGRRLPGLDRLEAETGALGHRALKDLKRRLDALEPPRRAPEQLQLPAPPEAMQSLLRRSMDDSPSDSRRILHQALLRELVPDEARILAALADGSAYPLVHVAEPGIGAYQKRVLENASSVGRAAGVALPDRTHIYLAHLRRLGLVETRDEDRGIRDEYEILLTDQLVRSTVDRIARGPRPARIIRRVVRISDLGQELWDATQP